MTDEGIASREEWADRFVQQAAACTELGSALYGRLLRLIAEDISVAGPTWQLLAEHVGLRFGQAGPLRLVGAAHRLALEGASPEWRSLLASCGGTAPATDSELAAAWHRLVEHHGGALRSGLDREVQTNEVARAAGLSLAVASAGFDSARLVELGCSGGLNLRMDRFRIELAPVGAERILLGDPGSAVRLAPEVRGHLGVGLAPLPLVTERIGIDPHPVDATSDDGRVTLLGFVWPDQPERFERIAAAIDLARSVPVDLRTSSDTADELDAVLSSRSAPTILQQSIMWQYVPTDMRWRVTEVVEAAGERATVAAPLAWVRFEPDEWDRRRAAVWLRTWPGGADRLVAHADYHGRWIAPAGGG